MKWIRSLICIAVLIAMLAGGLGFGLGLRHRHAGGESAHSHGHSHSHSHSHPHSHPHPHPHAHSHPLEGEEPSSHIHVTFFGIEITLPDFMGGEPAPLVAADSSDRTNSVAGEVVTIRGPIGLGDLVRIVTSWTAIRPDLIRVGHEIPLADSIGLLLPLSFGVDAPCPPLPPPEAS